MRNGLQRKLAEQERDLGGRQDMIDGHVVNGAPRHALIEGGLERLHDRNTFPLLDGKQPGSAIVEIPRQDHTHYPWAIAVSGSTKQRVYCGAVPVFLGALGQASAAIAEEEMAIRGSHVDVPGVDGVTVLGMPGG
jgi:hypothetical protein